MDTQTVLVANPCDAERALLSHALAGKGFNVLQAACAKEAIETAQASKPQLVLLDSLNWETPTLTTLSVLKHQSLTCRIPVVIFGNPRTKEEVTEAIRKGAVSWIGRKGFDLGRFTEKLSAVISKQRTDVAGSTATETTAPAVAVEQISQAVLEEILSQSAYLPVFEFSVIDAVTTTCAKDQAIRHISGIVDRDPTMTLALLAAANARSPAATNGISDPHEAINELGAKEFYQLAEAVTPLKLNLASIWDPGFYWAHSVATARIAGMLSKMVGLATPAAAVTAGLLHDIGYYVLANLFPKQYGAMFSAGIELESISPAWEKSVVGAHHGEIGAWAMSHHKLPAVVRDSAAIHHAPAMAGQTLAPLSRLVGMIVQAADCLAAALFPADPPLMSLVNPFEEFDAALDENSVNIQTLTAQARQIVAELLTEMPYLFPQSSARSFFYRSEPLNEVAYFAPGARALDVFRLFLETRSREMVIVEPRSIRTAPPRIPMVVNLSRIRESAAQIEILTSLMAARVTDNRPGIVLVPAALPDRAVQTLIMQNWRLVPLPAHSNRWVRFLEGNPANQHLHAAVA